MATVTGGSREPASDRVWNATIALVAITAVVIVGSYMLLTTAIFFLLAPLAGAMAALSCKRVGEAALVAPLGVMLGTAATGLFTQLPWAWPVWANGIWRVMLVALAVGAALGWVLQARRRLAGAVAGLALLLLIVAMWQAGMQRATLPMNNGATIAGMLTGEPKIAQGIRDEGIYLVYVRRLQRGQPYYPMVASVLERSNEVRPEPVNLKSPLSFRLPTLYWLLARLPVDAMWLVYATLGLGTLASASAFALARRFLAAPSALVSASAVAAFFVGQVSQFTILDAELWAGGLSVVSIAAFMHWRRRDARPLLFLAVGAALAAALVRELAIAVPLLLAIASIASKDGRKPREALPFAGAAAVALGVYAAHWWAAARAVSTLPAQGLQAMPWFHPEGLGLLGTATRLGHMLYVKPTAVWLLFAAAAAGSLLAPRRIPERVALAGAVLGGAVLVTYLYPPGLTVGGQVAGHWYDIIAPTMLASAPLAFARVPVIGVDEGRLQEPEQEEAPASAEVA